MLEQRVELEKILAQIVNGAKEVIEANAAIICLLNEDGTQLYAAAASGISMGEVKQELMPQLLLDEETLTRKFIVLTNANSDTLIADLPAGYQSCLCAPLIAGEKQIGTLCAYATEPNYFKEKKSKQLMLLADVGAVSIVNARELETLDSLRASRDKFIRIATHELRSPVTIAQSLVRGVIKGYAGKLSEKQQDVFGRINRSLDFLENLVNDLLDLAEGQTLDIAKNKEFVLISASIGRAVLLIQPQAEEKGVKLSYQTNSAELIVWGTAEGMDRVFVNIIENAVKYTPPGGSVAVSVQVAGEEIRVEVSDTGIGIPEKSIPLIFNEFYRAPNAKEGGEIGTGLGLNIVKDLVEGFGGKIKVRSKVGEGTTFVVMFPVAGD
ncbi:MAG: hypothetical protein DRI56_00815 [Chloroflexota bacterium]|nr:MAG: hypothetical protein DRI56_00815 [Chloroflexota bacterium]